jgi:GTPase SAR1 family protein
VAVQKKGPLTVLVVGPAGAGKSSTVNAIFGRQFLAAKPAEVSLPDFAYTLSFAACRVCLRYCLLLRFESESWRQRRVDIAYCK